MKILIHLRLALSPHLFQGRHHKDYANKTMDNRVLFSQNNEFQNEFNIPYQVKNDRWNWRD